MKITICGSIAFYDEMLDVRNKLEAAGHEVKLPPHEIKDDSGSMMPAKEYYARRKRASEDEGWIWDRRGDAMKAHFDKVVWADSILVLNYDKEGVAGYVGANTLMEMGLAFHFAKKIYLFQKIPDISCKEEILGMKPSIIDSDLNRIA